MAIKNLETDFVQLNLELEEEFVNEMEYLNEEDEKLLSLLEEILSEVFEFEPDPDSIEALEGNAIYNLDDEAEISRREKYEAESLNEGWPEVHDMAQLEELSRAYFQNPVSYPLQEEDFVSNHCTGFIQIYSGEKFDNQGRMTEQWKFINKKICIKVSDLMEPDSIISMIEALGIKWGPVFRVIFYGSPLVEVVGSRFYKEKESRELMSLSHEHKNILLALPDYSETEENSESIYDFIDREFQEGIVYGILPNVDRVTVGHWELTSIRLQEVFEEEMEEKSLFQILKKERNLTNKKNQFIETYSEARAVIRGFNDGSLSLDALYSLDLKILEDILFLCSRSFERINEPLVFAQLKAVVTKMNVLKLQQNSSAALKSIQDINSGKLTEIHLIGLKDLEAIFQILWGNSGIKILPEYKEVYYALKERLRVFRMSQSRSRK